MELSLSHRCNDLVSNLSRHRVQSNVSSRAVRGVLTLDRTDIPFGTTVLFTAGRVVSLLQKASGLLTVASATSSSRFQRTRLAHNLALALTQPFVATMFLTFVRTIGFHKSSDGTIPVNQFLKLLRETSSTGEQVFLFRSFLLSASGQRSSMLDTTEPFVWDLVASTQ
jgi:hypothetical protein